MGENILLNHCHAMEFTCISTVGTRGVFSTFQVTCNTSTDHKNKNLRSSLLSTVEQKKKRKKKEALTPIHSLGVSASFFFLFILILQYYIYIFFQIRFFLWKKWKDRYGSKQRGKRRRFALEMSAVSNFAPSCYAGGRSVSFSGTATAAESKFRSNMALIPRPFEVLISRITQNYCEFMLCEPLICWENVRYSS